MTRTLALLVLACVVALCCPATTVCQSSTGATYEGYDLSSTGDQSSAVYATDSTPNSAATQPAPDVYLHAQVHVGEIDLDVQNITAKINLDAQVLQLLQFNAGVDASIDRVFLTIQNVDAEVYLEARLENVLKMINSTLNSIDLNPILAELGSTLGNVLGTVGDTVGGVLGGSSSTGSGGGMYPASFQGGNSIGAIPAIEPSLSVAQNILYSVNNFQKNSNMNQVLRKDGAILSEMLDNYGNVLSVRVMGSYSQNMTFTGESRTAQHDGAAVTEQLWRYKPIVGIEIDCAVFLDGSGAVVDAIVIAEASGDANATVAPDSP